MSDPTREQVQRAYDLFKAGRRTEALHILQQVILMDDRNVNAWLLMAHVTDMPADKRVALDHVLRLNPNHARAKKMLAQLVEQYPELATKPSILAPEPVPVKPQPAKLKTRRPPKNKSKNRVSAGRQRLLIALGVAVLVVVVVVMLVVLITSA